MKLKANVEVIRQMLEVGSCIKDEVTVALAKEGLKIRQVDKSKIAMVAYDAPASHFETYEVAEEGETMTVDGPAILKGMRKMDGTVVMETKENKLMVVGEVGKNVLRFSVSIYVSEEPMRDVPSKTIIPVKLTLDAEEFIDSIESVCELVKQEPVAIKVDKDDVLIYAAGDSTNAGVKFGSDIVKVETEEGVEKTAKSLFSSMVLQQFKKALISKEIVVRVGVNMPLKIECAGTPSVTLFLAPRTEGE